MRTISAANEAIITGGARKTSVRLSVKDSGGTYRDLTTYPGENFLLEMNWGEGIDDPGIKWEASLLREMEKTSLAPTMAASGLNREWGISTVAALLQVGRKVKVEWCLQAEDDPTAKTWSLGFTGYLDTIEWGDEQVQLTGRGEEAVLIDTYIERERVYAFSTDADATKGMYIWEPSRVYLAGDLVIPTHSNLNGHFYSAGAGTSGTTEPVWPTGAGSTVASGSVTFTEKGVTSTSSGEEVEDVLGKLIADNGITLAGFNAATSGWVVRWFQVSRQPLFDEGLLLADQIGWCLRHKFDGADMTLSWYDPVRSNTTSMRTFSKSETRVTAAKVEVFDIRNAGRGTFLDSQDLDPGGNPKRKSIELTDSASITKYGRRFFEIQEDSNSNIDSTSEMTALLTAVLSDMSEPLADFEAKLTFFPFAEVTDLYTLAANDVHFSADQKLAVTSYQHRHSAKESSTTLRLRGKPASGYARWMSRMTDAGGAKVHALTAMENVAPIALTADSTPVGGARIDLTWESGKTGRAVSHELHLSTSSGFTPSSATLYASGSERSFEVGNLLPSLTYFAVVVPIVMNAGQPVRGQPSAQVQFTPGRGKATHLDPNVVWGRLPLNGGFETQLDPGAPPDFWTVIGGAWGAGITLGTSSGKSGAAYIKLATLTAGDQPAVRAAEMTVTGGESYAIRFWRKFVSGSGNNFNLLVRWYDESHGGISSNSQLFDLADSAGTWVRSTSNTWVAPAGARFAVFDFDIESGASGREVHVDSIELVEAAVCLPTTGLTAFAGGGQASAVALTGEVNFVATVATAADSVKLPVAVMGAKVVVFNEGANAANVYPQTGAAIDALGTNNPYSLAAGASREFWAKSGTAWVSR